MNKTKGIIVLLITVLVLGGLGYAVGIGFGPTGTGAAKNIILGLDLAGGVSITYETVDANPSAEDMSDTVYKLQKRAETYSSEAEVYQEGANHINIDIPGVSNADEVLQEMGSPGSLYFVDTSGNTVLEGTDVADAQAGSQQDQNTNAVQYVVSLTLTSEGAEKFATATQENLDKQIAIIYDDEVISSPVVKAVISDGNAVIDGMESFEEAENLASMIRIGGLSLELNELRSNVVGAKLGGQAISTSLTAGAIGIGLVAVIMIVVYLIPGLASALALAIYTLLMMLILNAFDVTLTLPGIAGIVLSIGMAVDANVIIFARIKEEIASGMSVKSAIQSGFKKALSAIVDGNVTTIIAAVILLFRGSGTVRGFAQTLLIGVILSMFTALVITRLILMALYAVGLQSEKFYGKAKERKVFDFVSKRWICIAISLVLIVGGFAVMAVQHFTGNHALNFSMEFLGGTSSNVTFNEAMDINRLSEEVGPVVEEVTGDANVQFQTVEGTNEVIIKTRTLNSEERIALNDALTEKFGVDKELINAESISATVSDEMRSDAVIAVILATICMLLYIWFRFSDVRFAGSAIIALLHDVLIVLGFYALSRISVGNTFIACMLTIVGYSINATIVIFDRIRENLKASAKPDLKEVVNKSITQTLTRSIYTTLTTFVTIAVLWIMGVSSIREFAAPIMVGLIAGVYSSVFLTGSIWYMLRTKFAKKD